MYHRNNIQHIDGLYHKETKLQCGIQAASHTKFHLSCLYATYYAHDNIPLECEKTIAHIE